MYIRDLLAADGPSVSFEFFPPKTPEGEAHLWRVITEDLAPLRPTFVSVTYGAGGSTRDRTLRLVQRIAQETTVTPMAHLTTVGTDRVELTGIIRALADAGVDNILALRGDPPADDPDFCWPEDLSHATDLITLIHDTVGAHYGVGVAGFPQGHPDSPDLDTDAEFLVRKVRAGADFVITQFFFDAALYTDLVARARRHGLADDVPVLPGIMPVTSLSSIERMPQMSGRPFPEDLARRLRDAHAAGGDDAVWRCGIDAAAELCHDLLDADAPGLHFYTLNKSPATRQLAERLGIVV
jgi:methylenetetrahydrofolate reductase (NADPH)